MSTVAIQWGTLRDDEWTGSTRMPNRTSQFKAGYTEAMNLLRYELGRVAARQVTVSMDISLGDVRRDGMLAANAKPSSSRVLLTFERRVAGEMRLLRFPCWRYLSWIENLYAVGKTLEALRAVERYGAVEQDQHVRGFAALGAGEGAPRGGVNTQGLALSPERAARILVEAHPTMGGSNAVGIDVLAKAMLDRDAGDRMLQLAQEARAAAHPDKGGSDGLFATVNAAFEELKRYHARRPA